MSKIESCLRCMCVHENPLDCLAISAAEFYEDGNLKRVEYFPQEDCSAPPVSP